jgi:hypothetical protein
MKRKLNQKTKAFSTLLGSLSIMGVNHSMNAQNTIVTHDINPDTLLDNYYESYDLDINNDNVNDFNFTREENTYYTPAQLIFFADGWNNNKLITFTNDIILNPTYNARLNEGDTISDNSTYNVVSYMAWTLDGIMRNNVYAWIGGTTDKYVGVQFKIGTQLHHGWIRVDVSSDIRTITIKEVGYESSPDALMKAGARISANKVSNILGSKPAADEDILVTFNKAEDESNISGYRIIIVPTSVIANLKLSNLQKLASDRYTFVAKTGNNISITIDKNSKDYDGYTLTPSVAYTAVVMSIGDATTGDAFQTGSPVLVTSNQEKELLESRILVNGKTIRLNEIPESGELKIINSIGHEIYSQTIAKGSSEIALEPMNNGIYTLYFQTENHTISKKIILSN